MEPTHPSQCLDGRQEGWVGSTMEYSLKMWVRFLPRNLRDGADPLGFRPLSVFFRRLPNSALRHHHSPPSPPPSLRTSPPHFRGRPAPYLHGAALLKPASRHPPPSSAGAAHPRVGRARRVPCSAGEAHPRLLREPRAAIAVAVEELRAWPRRCRRSSPAAVEELARARGSSRPELGRERIQRRRRARARIQRRWRGSATG